jgi:hypothetical protein
MVLSPQEFDGRQTLLDGPRPPVLTARRGRGVHRGRHELDVALETEVHRASIPVVGL